MNVQAIDINCDMGEMPGAAGDEQLLKLVSSANIACGFHAGDPNVMARTVKAAREHGVRVGAHPGLADREGFGRRVMPISPDEVKQLVADQIGALSAIATAADTNLQHVKLHGALYHMVNSDDSLARAAMAAVASADGSLIVLTSGEISIAAAKDAGLRVAEEFFVDRAYQHDGTLASRGAQGAVIHKRAAIADRLSQLFETGTVKTIGGEQIETMFHSICVHSDTPDAIKIAELVRQTCDRLGVAVKPLDQLVS